MPIGAIEADIRCGDSPTFLETAGATTNAGWTSSKTPVSQNEAGSARLGLSSPLTMPSSDGTIASGNMEVACGDDPADA